MFEQLRTQLEQSAPDIDQKLCRRSAYNFIYGISLFTFLNRNKLITIKKPDKKLSNIEKVKFALQLLQEQYPEFYYVDLPDYDLDDYTIRFNEKVLKEVAQATCNLTKEIEDAEEFWQVHEDFFISSF